MMINNKLAIEPHLKAILKKFHFIAYKLTGIRRMDNLKMNINLFKIFILPLYRLAFTLYARQNETIRAKVEAHMRVLLKRFARIPINTANHTLVLLAGDMKAQMNWSVHRTRNRLNERMEIEVEEVAIDRGPVALKYYPKTFGITLRAVYGSRCREH
jgi:hypothetical protein